MEAFRQLLAIAGRKSKYDENTSWFNGAQTYLHELKEEVDEVLEELPRAHLGRLEEELGDVLWDYLNAVVALEKDVGIDLQSVLNRASQKYEERVSGIESGESWVDIKNRQKQRVLDES